jgi:hypothetical protein
MTKLNKFFELMHESMETSSAEEIKDACAIIIEVQQFGSGERDCIVAAFDKGPLDDGDVPSKSGRSNLVQKGYMSKVVVKGQDGFNACTYKGAVAYKLIKAMFNQNETGG